MNQFDDEHLGADELVLGKPDELRQLAPVLRQVFDELKAYSGLGNTFAFDITDVCCPHGALTDRRAVAAFALRKLQAFCLLTRDGVRTKNSVIVILAADLNLALTELAADALSHRDTSVHDILVDGRNQINEVSHIAATLSKSNVVTLV